MRKTLFHKSLAARLLWHGGLVRLAGVLRRALRGPRLIILCYHRVDEDPEKPALSAAPAEFARQLEWFAGRFAVLPISAVAEYLSGREKLRRDSLVLTFDDGYRDNYDTVLPMLNRHRFPATYFIASDPLLKRVPYWYDALWARLERWSGGFPEKGFPMDMPAPLIASLEWSRGHPGKRGLQKVLDMAKGLDSRRRGVLMAWLDTGREAPSEWTACETMTLEEALDSTVRGIDIGGHTRTHPSLARIPDWECRAEILESLGELSGAGFDVRYFAYPFGEAVDVGGFGGHPRRVLKESGVRLAVTTEERAVRPGDDPLLVPRKVISPQTLAQIALKLELLAWRK